MQFIGTTCDGKPTIPMHLVGFFRVVEFVAKWARRDIGYLGPTFALPPPRCERCEDTKGVAMESSRTCYALDDGRSDRVANRDRSLCRDCAEEHHADWDERWQEYYGGLL